MQNRNSRRDFLRQLMGAFAAGALPAASLWDAASASATKLRISEWTGDNPKRGHEFRDKEYPKFSANPNRTVDFVIVGGGIAGLTAAWQLRDHDFLLLDQYETLGGQSRGGEFRGIGYSYGPIAVGSVEGTFGHLFSELGLTPNALPSGDVSVYFEKQWLPVIGDSPSAFYKDLKKLTAEAQAALDAAQRIRDVSSRRSSVLPLDADQRIRDVSSRGSSALPLDAAQRIRDVSSRGSSALPLDAAQRIRDVSSRGSSGLPLDVETIHNVELARLDATRFVDVLNGYDPQFLALIESLCKTITTGSLNQLSALAGYAIVSGLQGQAYTFGGGNQAVAKAIVAKLGGNESPRLVPGAFVWNVELAESGAKVMYTTAMGEEHTVACKHVIVATPPMVAWRQISNMDDKMRAALMKFKYGSYMVANFLLNKPLFRGSYQNILSSPFTFADLVIADKAYGTKFSKHDASVLTMLQPSSPGTGARDELLEGDRNKMALAARSELAQLVEHLDEHLEEIVMTRWGHALIVPGIGHFDKVAKIAALHSDSPYSLAYSGIHGMPRFESAVRGGMFAAARALSRSHKLSYLVTTRES